MFKTFTTRSAVAHSLVPGGLKRPSAVLLRRGPSTKAKYVNEIGPYLVRFGGQTVPSGAAPVAVVSIEGEVTVLDQGFIPTVEEAAATVEWIHGQIGKTNPAELSQLVASIKETSDEELNDRLRGLVMCARAAALRQITEEHAGTDTVIGRINEVLTGGDEELDEFLRTSPSWVRFWVTLADSARAVESLKRLYS